MRISASSKKIFSGEVKSEEGVRLRPVELRWCDTWRSCSIYKYLLPNSCPRPCAVSASQPTLVYRYRYLLYDTV